MKLKKKHFARLKEIAEKLNHELNYSGLLLSDLITDIESVQKAKAVEEKPLNKTAAFLEVCAKHQEELYANHLKQGESMVAASTDTSSPFTRGLRDAVEATSEQKVEIGSYLAYHKYDKWHKPVYGMSFCGYPAPELSSITVIDNDRSDYFPVILSDVILYRRVDDTIKPEIATDPKIGDVGYFWMEDTRFINFGKLIEFIPNGFKIENGTHFRNFSKTPPDLR